MQVCVRACVRAAYVRACVREREGGEGERETVYLYTTLTSRSVRLSSFPHCAFWNIAFCHFNLLEIERLQSRVMAVGDGGGYGSGVAETVDTARKGSHHDVKI